MNFVVRLPYLLFLALVLIPVGAVAYALAAVARAAWANAKAGWRDHS